MIQWSGEGSEREAFSPLFLLRMKKRRHWLLHCEREPVIRRGRERERERDYEDLNKTSGAAAAVAALVVAMLLLVDRSEA